MTLPCFISDAQEREFRYLAELAAQSIAGCGYNHGATVARRYASDFGHDADAMERHAADLAAHMRTLP